MNKKKIESITYTALFISIMAVLSQFSIPIGAVPITIQTFVVALTGYFLGTRKGLIAIFVYILLGALGAPVFANFQGGAHMIAGYTGGFIVGFLPFVFFCSYKGREWAKVVFGIFGLLICHLIGVVQYSSLSDIDVFRSFLVVSAPFLLKDILLTLCAYFLSKKLKRKLKLKE